MYRKYYLMYEAKCVGRNKVVYFRLYSLYFVANALHIDSTGSSKRVSTTNQSTIRIQKNGNVQIVGMYCTNVVAKTNSAFSCSKASTIDDVNILWRTQSRLKFESGSKRVNATFNNISVTPWRSIFF
jgi:hypothetical protein